ncbi:hypothetical protein ZWY2020_058886 [Hordeum vulgare]|nr:hypothetical protein ZWY2020_058886 [Hordeum vulgare]
MAYRVLEVTLISAKDLKKVTVFSKMRVYAVVSISGGDPRTPTHRTHSTGTAVGTPCGMRRCGSPSRPPPTRGGSRCTCFSAPSALRRPRRRRGAGAGAGPRLRCATRRRAPAPQLPGAQPHERPEAPRAPHLLQPLRRACADGGGAGRPAVHADERGGWGGADPVTAYPPYHHQQQHAVPPYGYTPVRVRRASYGYGLPRLLPTEKPDSGYVK